MKITNIEVNNRKRSFFLGTVDSVFSFPFAKTVPMPVKNNSLKKFWIDDDFGGEAFSFQLQNGSIGTVHMDQVLEYNRDPNYMTEILLYKLTLKAQREVAITRLSTREIIRRLGTSPAQYYRLLDQTNYTKSINKMINLFQVLGCEVEVVLKDNTNHSASEFITV